MVDASQKIWHLLASLCFDLNRFDVLGSFTALFRMHENRDFVGYPRIPFSLEFQMPPFFSGMNSARAFGSITASIFALTRLSDTALPGDKCCLYGHVIIA